MVTDKLLDIIFSVLDGLFSLLPDFNISFSLGTIKPFLDVVATILYFFPWQKVLPIIAIMWLLQMWRIVVSLIRVLWELLPLV